MGAELYINDVDYTELFIWDSIDISESLQANGQTMTVVIYGNIETEVLPAPVGGQVILFIVDDVIQFHGRIQVVGEEAVANPVDIRYTLDCVDFTADLDTQLLIGEFAADYAGNQIASIVGQIGKGFTISNVVTGAFMSAIKADYEPASSLITRIAEAIEHQWFVDYNRDLNFFYIADRPAPLATIYIDTDTNTYYDASYAEDVSQVKNVIYLSGAKAKSGNKHVMYFTGDGNTRFFPLAYAPHHGEDPSELEFEIAPAATPTTFGPAYTVKLDSVDSTVGDGNSEAATVFVCYDNWGCRLPDGVDAPESGDIVRVSYNYDYDPIVVVEDPVSIALMMERENTDTAPSDGRHEFKFDIPDLQVDSEDAILDYGELLLARYAFPVKSASFTSHVPGWAVGQSLTIVSERHNINETFYIHEVAKSTRVKNADIFQLQYQISASNSPFPG